LYTGLEKLDIGGKFLVFSKIFLCFLFGGFSGQKKPEKTATQEGHPIHYSHCHISFFIINYSKTQKSQLKYKIKYHLQFKLHNQK